MMISYLKSIFSKKHIMSPYDVINQKELQIKHLSEQRYELTREIHNLKAKLEMAEREIERINATPTDKTENTDIPEVFVNGRKSFGLSSGHTIEIERIGNERYSLRMSVIVDGYVVDSILKQKYNEISLSV